MDSSTLIEQLKLPLIGGTLLSLSSMNLMLDFSKVFGCSQALKSLQHSYKLIYFNYIQNRGSNVSNNTHLLYNHQDLYVAAGLVIMGSILRLFMGFIDSNLSNNDNSIFDSSVLSNSSATDHDLIKNVILFTLAGLLSGVGTVLASGCTSGQSPLQSTNHNCLSILFWCNQSMLTMFL